MPLPVVSVCFNPWGYRRIVENFRRFSAEMEANRDVIFFPVECAFAGRPFEVTDAGNPRHLQVRTDSPLWIKENLGNLGRRHVKRVLPAAEKLALVDGDVEFLNRDWARLTEASLDHHDAIQPWTEAIYGGPDCELAGVVTSFMSQYTAGVQWAGHPPKYGSMWHPGFAWGWRLDALDRIGGLFEANVVGGADLEMALGLIGRMDAALEHQTISPGSLPVYEAAVYAWQDRADRVVRRNVGVLKGMIRHHHHGHMLGRQYESRYNIPLNHNYNPATDIIANAYGVLEWAPHVVGLKYDIRGMFSRRNDDWNTPG